MTGHRTAPSAEAHPDPNGNGADMKKAWHRDTDMCAHRGISLLPTEDTPWDGNSNRMPGDREDRLSLLDLAASPNNSRAFAETVVPELRLTR